MRSIVWLDDFGLCGWLADGIAVWSLLGFGSIVVLVTIRDSGWPFCCGRLLDHFVDRLESAVCFRRKWCDSVASAFSQKMPCDVVSSIFDRGFMPSCLPPQLVKA